MIKEKRIFKLHDYYSKEMLINSYLLGFIFFLIPSSLIILLFANIIVLYIHYLIYLVLALSFGLILIGLFSNKIFIETLINYIDNTEKIDYKTIYKKLVLSSTVFIVISTVVGYIIYLSIN